MGVTWKNLTILTAALLTTGILLSRGLAAGWESAFPKPENEVWEEECGACHMAFTPGLLPARSWVSMLTGLQDHFGEDASVAPEARRSITAFLVANAADNPNATAVMRRIARSFAPGAMPLRITRSPLFRYYHEEVPDGIWNRDSIGLRSNCMACHTRAQEGRYVLREIEIPKE